MTNKELSNLTYAELMELSRRLDLEIADKRTEELKVLADGYVKKIQAAGFTVLEAAQALRPYLQDRQEDKGKSRSSATVLFRDPANPENTWSGRGRPARWLADYETSGRGRDEFRV